jgi:hypothetical protein
LEGPKSSAEKEGDLLPTRLGSKPVRFNGFKLLSLEVPLVWLIRQAGPIGRWEKWLTNSGPLMSRRKVVVLSAPIFVYAGTIGVRALH